MADQEKQRENTSPGDSAAGQGKAGSTAPCPICHKAVAPDAATFPFCSQRCRQIDLGRWLGGHYRISRPIEQADVEQDEQDR